MGDWDAPRVENVGWELGRREKVDGGTVWLSTGCAGKEGESSTLYVAVIFYGLSRIMLERKSALPAV